MKREKFDEIYNSIIVQIKADIDNSNTCKFKLKSAERIFNNYQNEKYKLKKYFMLNEEDNIDRHKIAACMMYAIMKVYPIYIPLHIRLQAFAKKQKFSLELSYANEYLAIMTAISILDNFYNQDLQDGILNPRRRKIVIPETFNDDYGFIFNTCIDLKFGKRNNNINILTFANLFFLMEYDFNHEQEQRN